MKQLLLTTLLLLLSVATQAESRTLMLYADGCSTANVITCPEGQQVRIMAKVTMSGNVFERWSDGVTANPRLVTVNSDMSLTAIYHTTPTYTLLLYANGCDVANVITCPEGQQIRVTAETTLQGSRFTSWSDGVTTNPRLITVNSDTTLTAIYGNYCGDNLRWEYADGVLSIMGYGTMYDFSRTGQPWSAFADEITNIVMPNGMTYIGNYAFYGLQNRAFTHLVLPQTVTEIGAYAFANCNRLTSLNLSAALLSIADYAFSGCISVNDITCMASTRPDIEEHTFDGVSNYAYLYVPCDYKRSYQLNAYWNRLDIQCAGAQGSSTGVTGVEVNPSDNMAVFTWPADAAADSYTISITKDDEVFCTLIFNGNGQLMGIAFALGKDGTKSVPAARLVAAGTGWQFTVTGLSAGTHYNYSLVSADAASQTLASYTGEFTTSGTTALDAASAEHVATKLIRDGKIVIVRDGKEYDVVGHQL